MNRLKFCRAVLVITVVIAPIFNSRARGQDEDVYTQRRMQMVLEYIEREGIKNESVLRAMREVPRHLFVPQEMKAHAYKDYTIPMAHRMHALLASGLALLLGRRLVNCAAAPSPFRGPGCR